MSRIRYFLLAALCTAQSLSATTYHVAATGNDGANGSSAAPFKTLSKAAGIVNPGDSVLVADGTYDGVTLNRAGTAAGWIVFKSTNKHGATISNAGGGYAGFAVYASYIEINGFEVTNPAGHGISVENSSHVRVLNCHSHHNGNSGITGAWGDFYHFEGNICNNNATLSWYSGISIYQATDIGEATPGYHTIIRNNICYANFTDAGAGLHTDGNGIIIDDWNHTQATGEAPFTYPAMVENNLCYDNGGAGIKTCWSDNITVRNNTCYNNNLDLVNDGTYRGEFYCQDSRNNTFINNIAYTDPTVNPNNSAAMDKGNASGDATAANTWQNNIFFNGTVGSSATDFGDGSTPVLIDNLDGTDPLFVNPAADDFTLQAGSPALDGGTDGDIGWSGGDAGTEAYLQFATGSSIIAEDAGTVTITVYRTGSLTDTVTVEFTTANGSATAGYDYTPVAGTKTFYTGVTARTITVALIDDDDAEDSETFTLTLRNPSSGALLGSPSGTVITIRDNDYDLSSPLSVWSASDTPATPADGDDAAVELGLRFTSAVAGYVSAVRFYKGAANTGTHVGNLWSSTGTNLSTVTFAGETASGWQEQAFGSPVAIDADTEYIISYFAPDGHYAADAGAFSSGSILNGPLEAINSVYKYGSTSVFPDQTFGNTNYWVDVVFTAAAGAVGTPAGNADRTDTALRLQVNPCPLQASDRTLRITGTGETIPGFITLYTPDGTRVPGLLPAGNGSWRIPQLAPGIYLVAARIDGNAVYTTITVVD